MPSIRKGTRTFDTVLVRIEEGLILCLSDHEEVSCWMPRPTARQEKSTPEEWLGYLKENALILMSGIGEHNWIRAHEDDRRIIYQLPRWYEERGITLQGDEKFVPALEHSRPHPLLAEHFWSALH